MNRNRWRFSKSTIAVGVFGLAVGLLAGLTVLITGKPATGNRMGLVDDWSTHHLVFSNPGTAADALAQGRLEQWERIVNEPRHIMQRMKRNPALRALATAPDFATLEDRLGEPIRDPKPILPAPVRKPKQTMKKDWSLNMGGVAATLTSLIATLTSSNVDGSSTLTVDNVQFNASAPTAATQTGTFSSPPATGAAITVKYGANTLTLTTSGTPSTATGAFTGPPSANTSISILTPIAGGTNTLAMTTNATAGAATGTFTTGTSTGTITIITSAGASSNTLTLTMESGGSNTCTSSTAGTVANSSTLSTEASNVNTAINSCHSSYTSLVNVTSNHSSGSASFTITATTPGPFLAVGTGETATDFSWGSVSGNSAGSNTCNSSTSGYFATVPSGTAGASTAGLGDLASNLAAAINSCNSAYPTLVGATANYASGTSFTVTDTIPGSSGSFSDSNVTNIFSWTSTSTGSNGSNSCSSSTTALYGTSTSTSTLAGNLRSAINDCPAGTGLTTSASRSGANVTITALTAGSSGNSIGLSPSTTGFFQWGGSYLAGGADGTTSGTSSPPTFAYWSGNNYVSSAQVATNIATAINANTTLQTVSSGVSATANAPSSGDVTITARSAGTGGNNYSVWTGGTTGWWGTTGDLSGGAGASVQPNADPAKWGASTTAAWCGDYVVYPTGTAGASNAASIVAYYALYSGCSSEGTVPMVYWAYDTGGTITTSPIISVDGSQVAFIQSNGTTASLVLLKPVLTLQGINYSDGNTTFTVTSGPVPNADDVGMSIIGFGIPSGDTIKSVSGSTVTLTAGVQNDCTDCTLYVFGGSTVGTPATPASVSNSNYRGCTAPCMTTLAFDESKNDTFSAPFYDYWDDDLYVGDDGGYLHQFTGVFVETPGENTTSPWPVTLNTSYRVTSPVYDPASGNVFVGNTDAVLYSVGSGNEGTTSGKINAYSHSLGDVIIDGPLVDPSAETVYAFVTTNSSGNNAVYQFNANFTGSGTSYGNAATTGTQVGTGGTGWYLYDGTFDNVYFSSATPTGNLWVAGQTNNTGNGTLYQIPMLDFTVSGTTASGSKTVTLTTSGSVPSTAKGAPISGPGITAPNYITNVSSTTITLETAAGTGYGLGTLTIVGMGAPNAVISNLNTASRLRASPLTEFCNNGLSPCTSNGTATTAGIDYLFFSVARATMSGNNCGSGGSGDGCVLSYEITNPSVTPTLSGSLEVTDIGSTVCWSTGGIVIDGSVPTGTLAGASQVYFINLNGNEAVGGGAGTCGSGSATYMQAVQASQAALQ